MISSLEILNTTTNSIGGVISDNDPGGAFQATIVGTGAVSCTVTLHASLDKSNWVVLGTIMLSGTNTHTDGFISLGSWFAYRATTSDVTGNVSYIKVNMSVVS